MAPAISLFLLLLSALCATTVAQQRESNISLGSSLTATTTTNSSWLSRSGLYAFGFYRQGNGFAVGVFIAGTPEQNVVVWTANRNDPPVPGNATLTLTRDGRLILQSTQGQDISIADSNSQPASSASMLNSGNFVIYNSNQTIIWESFDHPTDTLLPGQSLSAGEQLLSSVSINDHSSGIFQLDMQPDGNLVLYPVNAPNTRNNPYWASGTDGVGANVTLNLGVNGLLYLLNSNTSLRNLTQGSNSTQGTIYLAKLDIDGIFRLYSLDFNQRVNFSAIWSTPISKCDPRGVCGLNGYCVLSDDGEPNCRCLPGFDSVNPRDWSSGCERNFTVEDCKDEDGRVTSTYYTMTELENTWWEDMSYSSFSSSKEDCKSTCLKDCNCEAAFFQDGNCKKQRLPLRYGRRILSYSAITFIKVGGTSSTPNNTIIKNHLPRQTEKELRKIILIVSVSFIVIAFLVLVISGVLIYRNYGYAYRKISETTGNVELYEDVAPRAFTYAELEQVTDGFKEEVGKGSFGTVYKGIIMQNQKVVAVKRLDKVLAEGEREFQTEMKVIGKTHHRNLVRLLGYCVDGPNRLLVYEFMSNGSLADLLFSTSSEKKPYWDERISIALDIARGILYLHEECETQIIHCDIKPQNILMDECRCAKIADFGLAKLLKPDQTNTFTGIRGTRGYVAPEWHRKLPVTVKADIYSYGIVLFEIICCRRSVDWSLSEDEAVLEEWVYECSQAGEVGKLVGDEKVDKKKLERIVRVGLWCIQDEPSLRPSMKKVLLMLEGTIDIPIPPSPASFLSAI